MNATRWWAIWRTGCMCGAEATSGYGDVSQLDTTVPVPEDTGRATHRLTSTRRLNGAGDRCSRRHPATSLPGLVGVAGPPVPDFLFFPPPLLPGWGCHISH